MPAVLDKDKPKLAKPEAFVEKQIQQARGRIRTLDFFQTGLVVLIASLAFTFALVLFDRAYETPRGTLWAVITAWILGLAGYVWFAVFRQSRRHINPFYAAQQVEQTIPGAKNSVINYVDLQDDESVPASVKASIGAKAAKDMKQVDLNQAIQKKQVLWLAAIAGAFFIAVLIASFLPATRTTMKLLSPEEGNVTVGQGEDVIFKVKLEGRIPEKDQPDKPRVRIWYNPDDPANFEERPLEPVDGERNVFGHALSAKQVRNGFFYQLFAGNVKTPAYEVKLRIIPQFTGNWEVEYAYPTYLGREPEKKTDPNLVGYFNTQVTLTAHANRPIRSSQLFMEIDGQAPSFAGIAVPDDPEAMRFQFPMIKNGRYRIKFVTTEGHENPDPQWFRMSLIDPKPVLRFFDVTYDYPKYLRYEKVTVKNVREPRLEANRGTVVTIVAHANRPIKHAQIQMDGIPGAIQGTVVKEQPMQATFKLPALMADGAYRIDYTPDTGEPAAELPVKYSIKIIGDDAPQVAITKPQQIVSEIPANGNLPIEGIATDDHGLTGMNLRFEVIKPAPNMQLKEQPYRGGISFKREADGSFPNRIDYKDLIELGKLQVDGKPFAVQEGMEIEYWLEAIDNCDVPPGPNSGYSPHFRIKVLAPEMNPEKKKQQEKDKQNFEQDKKQHEQQQDQKNEKEERKPDQKKPMGEPQKGEPGGEGDPGAEQPKDGPKKEGGKGMGQPKEGDAPADAEPDPELKKQEDKVKELIAKNNPMGGAKDPKTDPNKDDPAMKDPNKPESKPEPKKDEKPDPRQLPKPEDVNKLAEKLDSLDKKEHDEAREQIKKNIEQAKNDPRKPDEAQKQLDEHRKKLDEPERKQFDESLERVAKEMQDIQREKRVQDAVDKITSGDKQKREQGQKDLENELRDPKTKEDTERQLQNLAGDMGTERKKQIGDATNLAKENAKKPPQKTGPEDLPPPKEKEDENVDKLAKKQQKGTEEEKKEAQEQLEKALRDPAQRDKVQKQLDDFKENIKDKQEREDFEKAMKEVAENAKKDKDPSERKAEEIQKLAEQLKSDDKKVRDAAQKQIEEALKQADKDPKATADAQKQLKETRDGIKEPMKQERFDQAVKEINEAVQKHRQEQAAAQEKMKKDLDNVAKGLNDKDPAKQKEAQQKLEQMLKDPKTREQVKNELDKLKQGAGDPQTKENIDKATEKAVDDVARKESLEKIAKDLNGKDGDRKNVAQKKLEEKLSDPKTREQVKNDLEKLKAEMKDKEARDNLDKAVGEAEKQIAQNQREAEKLASDLNSKDPDKQKAAQDKLEEMLKDPARREQVKNELDKLKKDDPKAKENIDKALEKANEDIARQEESEKIANGLTSKNPDKQKAARQKLEDKLADPKSREQVKNDLQKFKDGLKDQGAKEKIDDAVDQAEKNIAKNKQEAEKIAQDLTGKDKGKQEAAQQKLNDLLDDPAKREQVKQELERIKKGLADDQAKAKIDEALKNADANNLARKDAPKREELEKIANDLKSKDAATEKAAERKLRDALKDPRTRAKVEKDFNDIKDKATDPGDKQRLADALNKAKDELAKLDKPLDPKEIEKLVRDLKGKDPKAAEEAKKKLDEMLDDPDMRQKLAKALEELMKDAKGDAAKKDLDEQIKELKDQLAKKFDPNVGKTGHVNLPDGKKPGNNTNEPAKEGALGDLKNKAKAGDLVLEEFKRNITNEEFRKKLGWTDEQIRKFQEDYEKRLLALKKQIELAEQGKLMLPRDKGGKSSSLDTVEKIRIEPADGSNPLQGGKYIAPPGFGDPYKRFTEDRPILPATDLPKK